METRRDERIGQLLQALKRSLVLRQARPQVVEEILKLEGAERCPVLFED